MKTERKMTVLRGKTAVVTGASRGIGKAIALELARQGAKIALVYRGSHDAAAAVKAEIGQNGGCAELFPCDVSRFDDVGALAGGILEAWGGTDILVNNAGIVRDRLVMRMKEEDFDAVLDTNLKGAFNLIRHFLPSMLRRRQGRIINIASVIGLTGNAGQANYAAAKAGLIGLTKSVAKEAAPRGVTCNAIAPGFIDTDMTEALGEDKRLILLGMIPLSRTGAPEDVAHLAAFLASDDASYITGETIRVDGGLAI